jgi:protein involved in polysaccharide export with SLBB domain
MVTSLKFVNVLLLSLVLFTINLCHAQNASIDSTFAHVDAIKISVYPDSLLFLNGFYRIDNNGCVDLPVKGIVSIRDKTNKQFIDYLKNEYTDYLKYPNINIKPFIRVSFWGGFANPGLYWVEPSNSLWDAIQIAGGNPREDGLSKIRWERDGKIISDNIIKDFQSGISLTNMGFKSGDQLCSTAQPKRLFWEKFREDVVPILSITLTALTTSLTAYSTYRILTETNR